MLVSLSIIFINFPGNTDTDTEMGRVKSRLSVWMVSFQGVVSLPARAVLAGNSVPEPSTFERMNQKAQKCVSVYVCNWITLLYTWNTVNHLQN